MLLFFCFFDVAGSAKKSEFSEIASENFYKIAHLQIVIFWFGNMLIQIVITEIICWLAAPIMLQ